MIYQCLEHYIERFTVIPDQYGIPLQCFRMLFTNNTIPPVSQTHSIHMLLHNFSDQSMHIKKKKIIKAQKKKGKLLNPSHVPYII